VSGVALFVLICRDGSAPPRPALAQGCPGNDSLCHGACSVRPRQIGLFWLSRHRRTEHAVSR
jgi:hypothetical protein